MKKWKRAPKTIEEYLRLRRRDGTLLTSELFTDLCKRIKTLEKKR